MMLSVATAVAYAIYTYLAFGLIFGLLFAFRTTRAVAVKGFVTRLMLVPGAMLIWPLLIIWKRPS